MHYVSKEVLSYGERSDGEMIGFIKWLICQYQISKMEKAFKRNDDKFINLFSQCRNYGFTEEQILYILNLINASDNK